MRNSSILIRLSHEEREKIELVAEETGLPTSSWARNQLVEKANKKLQELDKNNKWTIIDNEIEYKPTAGNLLSLFCGPGGLDLGFREAGFNTEFAIDIDKDCINTFRKNHPHSRAEIGDLSKITVEELDDLVGKETMPTGVIGGPPCQSFSVSNVHQKDNDPRHLLPEAYAMLLNNLNKRHPISFFLFENVPGLLGKKHLQRYKKFKRLFTEAGFTISEKLLDASDYDIPQIRPRIFIIGINHDLHPNVNWIPPKKIRKRSTVKDAIFGLEEPKFNEPGINPDTVPVHPNHICMVPRSDKFKHGMMKPGTVIGRCFRVLSWDEPSWTVAYGHREVHIHPNGHRRLSIYEAMLLQSFPNDYQLIGNISAQVRLVSEAVPPKLAYFIAKSIRESLGL